MTSMIGRADIPAPLEMADRRVGVDSPSGESTNAFRPTQKHPQLLVELGNLICTRDASNIIEACSSRVLRSGAKVAYKLGDIVEAFNPDSKTWDPNFVVVGKKGVSHDYRKRQVHSPTSYLLD